MRSGSNAWCQNTNWPKHQRVQLIGGLEDSLPRSCYTRVEKQSWRTVGVKGRRRKRLGSRVEIDFRGVCRDDRGKLTDSACRHCRAALTAYRH